MVKRYTKLTGILAVTLMGYFLCSFGSEVENSQELTTPTQNTITNSPISNSAKNWNLTDSEWENYKKLMQGPNGHWYPQLTPPAVLGLNATNDKERQHFAEIVAREEHDKIARELSFNHEVYLAVRRLYPTESIIQSFDKSAFNPQLPEKRP